MAFTEVGGGTQRAKVSSGAIVASQVLAFPGNVTADNLLVALGVVNSIGTPASSVAVTSNRATWTVYDGGPVAEHRAFIAIGVAVSSGADTVTVTPVGNTADISFAVDEFSSDNPPAIDVDDGMTQDTGTAAIAIITTLTDDALVLGVVAPHNNGAITPGGGFTQIAEEEDGSLFEVFGAQFIVAGVAGAVGVDWTVANAVPWMVQVISVKEVPVVAPASDTSDRGRRSRR